MITKGGFGEVADGGNGETGSDFDNGKLFAGEGIEPIGEAVGLFVGSMTEPTSVGEHEDVGAGDATAVGAGGELA